jgi:hypothetical protein
MTAMTSSVVVSNVRQPEPPFVRDLIALVRF